MVAIEIVHKKDWHYFWLETYSMLVSLAFKSSKVMPWHLQNRWNNYIHLTTFMNLFVTHIYREGNKCDDTLANTGLHLASHVWFSQPPDSIKADLVHNKLGLPRFRIS